MNKKGELDLIVKKFLVVVLFLILLGGAYKLLNYIMS
jgi:hypothetical protein